jgi:hypothetical protein
MPRSVWQTTNIINNNNTTTVHHHHHHHGSAAAAASSGSSDGASSAAASSSTPTPALPYPQFDTPLPQSDFLAMMSPNRTRFRTNVNAFGASMTSPEMLVPLQAGVAPAPRHMAMTLTQDTTVGVVLRACIAVLLTNHRTKNLQANGETLHEPVQGTLEMLRHNNVCPEMNPSLIPEIAQYLLAWLMMMRVISPCGFFFFLVPG